MSDESSDLKPGEFRLSCPQCGWQGEKNAASANQCPRCGRRGLLLTSEKPQPSQDTESK